MWKIFIIYYTNVLDTVKIHKKNAEGKVMQLDKSFQAQSLSFYL